MKLVILAGPNQGKIIALGEGNNFIGRADENSIALPSGQVSRRHACVSFVKGRVFLEDLGSSNGTFFDGKRLSQKVELRSGMRFQVGEFILEFSADGRIMDAPVATLDPSKPAQGRPQQRGATAQSPVMGAAGSMIPGPIHTNLRGTDSTFWQFYNKIAFLGWRGQTILCAMGAISLILGIGIYPLLLNERVTLTEEVLKRGEVLVNRLALRNGEFIKSRQETNLDTAQVMTEQGVTAAYLLSKELLILSPVEQRGRQLANPVSKEAWLKKGEVVRMEDTQVPGGGGEPGVYHLATPIRVWSSERGIYENYGVAYVVIRAREVAEVNAQSERKFGLAASIVCFAIIGFVAAMFLVTNKPLKRLGEDAELVLRGDLRTVESRARWKELIQLAHSLNRSFDRYHQAAAAGAAAAAEAAGPSFLAGTADTGSSSTEDAKVEAISNAVAESVIVTDEMQRVVYLNEAAERLFDSRLDHARNRHIMEVILDQELLGSVLDIFKMLINSQEKTVSLPVTIKQDGSPRKAALVASGVKNRTGQLSYAAIVVR